MDIEEQYDKIYRFCYLRVRHRETAEDITQETFLRYLEHPQYHSLDKTLQLLYTIAVSYTHLRAHETPEHLVCRLLLEKKKKQTQQLSNSNIT